MSTPQFFETTTVAELIHRGLACRPYPSPAKASQKLQREASVLVVDDERTIADTLVLILNSKGFRAAAAYSGETALQLMRAARPDILITDVMMPGMNGVELATEVRQSWPACRILLFSGNAATSDLVESARQQGQHFELVAKPVHPEELIRRLSSEGAGDEAA